ncbi:MAG TPA: NTP transferase domain-containing protein, partial [Thermoanaerobaculia bacterium]
MHRSKTKKSSSKRRVRAEAPGAGEGRPQIVVLAAGIGSRMRSTLPKVLHKIGGRTLLDAVLDTAEGVSPSRIIAVVGAGRESVEAALSGRDVAIVVQDPPLGTGDAARRGREALSNGSGPVLILSGDAPLLTSATLTKLIERRRENGLDLAFLTFRPPEVGELGRIVRDAKGRVRRIVETRNASAREKRLPEANAGVYCFSPGALSRALG